MIEVIMSRIDDGSPVKRLALWAERQWQRYAWPVRIHWQTARGIRNVNLGSRRSGYDGWIATDIQCLDMTRREDWARYFAPSSLDRVLCEHVFEHLTADGIAAAVQNIHEFLKPRGLFRVAVPDGNHPDPRYIRHVGLDGPDGHLHLFTVDTLEPYLKGFYVTRLEWWEGGEFRHIPWSSEDGHVRRSRFHDPRNKKGPAYTSIILDARKPSD